MVIFLEEVRKKLQLSLNIPASALKETGNSKKNIKVQGEINPQPGGVDNSKLRLAKLQYIRSVYVQSFNTIEAKL